MWLQLLRKGEREEEAAGLWAGQCCGLAGGCVRHLSLCLRINECYLFRQDIEYI